MWCLAKAPFFFPNNMSNYCLWTQHRGVRYHWNRALPGVKENHSSLVTQLWSTTMKKSFHLVLLLDLPVTWIFSQTARKPRNGSFSSVLFSELDFPWLLEKKQHLKQWNQELLSAKPHSYALIHFSTILWADIHTRAHTLVPLGKQGCFKKPT